MQSEKWCPYSGKKYKRAHDHRRNCVPCKTDYDANPSVFRYDTRPPTDSAGGAGAADSSPTDSSTAADSEAPPRQPFIEIDAAVGEDTPLPRYRPEKFPVDKAVEAAKAPTETFSKTSLGLLFELPIDLIAGADGTYEMVEKPHLSEEKKKLLIDAFYTPLNRFMMKVAGKNVELAAALMIVMLVYAPVAWQSVKYRQQHRAPKKRRYQTDTQKGFEHAGIGTPPPEPPAPEAEFHDTEEMQRDLDKVLKSGRNQVER